MSDPVVGSEKDRTMQVIFFRQHFGQFALGMASVDEAIKNHQESIDHHGISEKFFIINRGGLSMHPWAGSRSYEDQIAVVGSGLIDNLDAVPCLYARYRCREHSMEIDLQYQIAKPLKSLPSPERMAEDIMWTVGVTVGEPKRKWWQWTLTDKNRIRIPPRYRRLLDKTMTRIDDSLGQSVDFF